MTGRVREEPDGRPGLDYSWQGFHERPFGDDGGETIDVVADDPDGTGEETVENVPIPGDGEADAAEPDGPVTRPRVDGQSTWTDWGWSP